MESLEYIFNTDSLSDISDMHELSTETPIGWSSICLDQTINYYIDYNSTLADNVRSEKEENRQKHN